MRATGTVNDQPMTLYYTPGSCSLVPHVTLEEAGAKFDAKRIDLAREQQRTADYLKINPKGRVPVLLVGDEAIAECIGILTYIAYRFPLAEILPFGSPATMGRAYEVMSWLASTVHVSIAQIWRTERFTSDPEATVVLQRDGRSQVAAHFESLEKKITGEWVLGDQYSALDPYFFVFWRWGQRLALDMSEFPNWRAHSNRVTARPAVARVLQLEAAPAQPSDDQGG